MWKTKKKAISFIVISILLAVFCTVIYVWTEDRHEFGYLLMTVALDDEHNFLVDEKDGYYYLLYTENDKIKKGIKYKIIDNGCFNLPNYIYVDGDDIYIQNFYKEVGYVETNMESYRVDIENRRMVKVDEYSDEDINELLAAEGKNEIYEGDNFYVEDGNIIHLIESYSYDDEKCRVYKAEFQNGSLVLEDLISIFDVEPYELYRDGEHCLGFSDYGSLMLDNSSNIISKDEYYAVYQLGADSFAARNILTGGIDLIEDDKITAYDELNDALEKNSVDITDIKAMGVFGERTLLSLYDENGASLLEFRNGKLSYKNVIWHTGFLSKTVMFLSVLIFSMIIVSLVYLFVSRVMRKFVVAKIAVILVVALILCDCLVYCIIKNVMNSEDVESLELALEQKAWQWDSMELVSNIYDFGDKEEEKVAEFRNELLNIQQEMNISDLLNITTEYYGVDKSDGSLLCISDSRKEKRIGQNGFDFEDASKEMLATGNKVFFTSYDKFGQSTDYLLYPTLDDKGEINGGYLLSMTRLEAEYETDSFMGYIIRDILLVNAALAVLCLLIVGIFLYPLAGLRKRAKEVLEGELSEGEISEDELSAADSGPDHRKKYLNEIDLIIANFNEMSETVLQNMSEIGRLRESNKIYFQNSILEALEKQSITQVNFREKVTETFYVISVKLPEVYDRFHNFEGLLQRLSEQLKLYQGFIGDIYGNRMLLCSKQQELENVLLFFGRENPGIQAVFDKAAVQIAVIGEGEKYCFSITLVDSERKRQLDRYHDTVKGFLLATGRAVRDEKAASMCCVGCLENGEYVYEINMDSRDRKKKLIRRIMQEALRLYHKENYKQARFLFARVLMKCPGNDAAAYYIRSIEDGQLNQNQV